MEINEKNEVVVTDIKMPFMSMVVFMIKWVIASIPAIIILSILFMIMAAVFGSIGTSLRGY
jgi:hypothetical protein